MSTNENSRCDRTDLVRDYAFEELAPAERKTMEQHLTTCSTCADELDGLRLTTAVLRVLPDVEVPRRIAFVSDKVHEPGWFASFWNSPARLGFAAACVLAAGLSFSAWHRPAASMSPAEFDAAVNKAVALAVDKREKDLIMAVSSNIDFLQRQNLKVTRASFSDVPMGVRE